jgi:hypothetical protein
MVYEGMWDGSPVDETILEVATEDPPSSYRKECSHGRILLSACDPKFGAL